MAAQPVAARCPCPPARPPPSRQASPDRILILILDYFMATDSAINVSCRPHNAFFNILKITRLRGQVAVVVASTVQAGDNQRGLHPRAETVHVNGCAENKGPDPLNDRHIGPP
ncbi:hypothetical protein J6590_065835 [Homalodisca vitripennis]|nr:hypothetical protein J6590_065835 [Homalodisca vitripennis]